ncbi:trehalose-phosphatase [Tenggerimyces flavus]|uniref:Trehalose 6-phosphate phosphatase n=1 Tax=Tenggerimyces flavus TaxID=1708749 RepID=A0ABV7Y7L3_9ACTN|nr:trehalose-phosphatase [Tenggerimyces flavus]MBM7785181.1 trehalose 6-phosphate phosphatase [Tenggerimyces flavus]
MTAPLELPQPRTPAGQAGLAALLANPSRALLAFDFDGVLSPIIDDPARAAAHPGAIPALARLAPHVGALAIVTGRSVAQVLQLGRFADEPALARLLVAGHYGLERWSASSGEIASPPPFPGVAAARQALPGLLNDLVAPAGTAVEDKGHSVAVHFRNTPSPADAQELLTEPLTTLARSHGLAVQPGRMVVELRPPDMDKGATLGALVLEVGAEVVTFAGDDLGDLPAYDAVDSLRESGMPGLLICSASDEVRALSDRADLVLDGPARVVAFLETLASRWG